MFTSLKADFKTQGNKVIMQAILKAPGPLNGRSWFDAIRICIC